LLLFGSINLGFLLRKKLAAVLIIPSSWGSQLAGYLHHQLGRISLFLRKGLNMTPYEILTKSKPNISYYRVFGCKCFVLRKGVRLGNFDPKAIEGIFVGYGAKSHTYRVFNKSTGCVEQSCSVVFEENNSSQGGRDVVACDIDDEIPQDAIRRMGVRFFHPIEGHLVADREGLCSTQVEPSSSQAQQASPKEATNAPTEEQDKDLHEEEGAPPSSPVISTAPNSSQDQDQPTHKESNVVHNDDQGQVGGQDGDQNDQDDQVIPQRSNEEIPSQEKS
jgi:hypothetical protein